MLVFGCGVALYLGAAGALRWLPVIVVAAWIGQLVGERLVGAGARGFVGALVMTPIALGIARLRDGPPSQVTFLPAFWLRVPGAIGLIGVTEVVGDPASAGIEDLVRPLGSIVSIALGVLCGALDLPRPRGRARGVPALHAAGGVPPRSVAVRRPGTA